MTFSNQLNEYIIELECTAKELSAASGLSGAVISRYRSGERVPEINSEQIDKLINGIVIIASSKGISEISENKVKEDFKKIICSGQVDYKTIISKFNSLVAILDINMTELSRSINFDASYLSRIRSGQRKPADIEAFINGVCNFITKKFNQNSQRTTIAELIGVQADSIINNSSCFRALTEWLVEGTVDLHDYMEDFLSKLDKFDLDEYMRTIHFNELKVPSVSFQMPTSNSYYGIEEMKKGELDFFKSTVLSKSSEDVFICSDMPMEDVKDDVDYGKKWMFALAMVIKKGLHINIIHNVERPFREIMLGLQIWIPIYMTGQISPFYLKGTQNNVYCHINYVSGGVALTGECINNYFSNGRYYLTKNKEELMYYKRKAADLLSKTQPLMEIYKKNNENIYNAFLNADALEEGNRHNILSALPVYTLSEELLERILKNNSVSGNEAEKIKEYVIQQKKNIDTILQCNNVKDEVVQYTENEFMNYSMVLSLSGMFYEKEIIYTYNEYLEHFRLTTDFINRYSNYSLLINPLQAFRNIQILIHEGKYAIISKNKSPNIHFVIRHPKILYALENFIAPVNE